MKKYLSFTAGAFSGLTIGFIWGVNAGIKLIEEKIDQASRAVQETPIFDINDVPEGIRQDIESEADRVPIALAPDVIAHAEGTPDIIADVVPEMTLVENHPPKPKTSEKSVKE